jgi:putative membrane protein
MSHHHHHGANPLREVLIGAAAGVGGAFVMDRFQALWSQYGEKIGLPGGARQEGVQSAPEQVADLVAETTTGERLPVEHREQAEKAVHYATGAALGVAYGVLASSVRGSTIGAGLPFGAAAFFLLDQGLVPKAGLGYAPQAQTKDQKTYSLVSHLVFGFTVDALRRVLGAR